MALRHWVARSGASGANTQIYFSKSVNIFRLTQKKKKMMCWTVKCMAGYQVTELPLPACLSVCLSVKLSLAALAEPCHVSRLHWKAFCMFALPSHADTVAQLIPDADSRLHERVQQYRQLLDGLPMDAYTHGCILHPELTTDSMIPKYATAEIRSKWSHCDLHCINMAGTV